MAETAEANMSSLAQIMERWGEFTSSGVRECEREREREKRAGGLKVCLLVHMITEGRCRKCDELVKQGRSLFERAFQHLASSVLVV